VNLQEDSKASWVQFAKIWRADIAALLSPPPTLVFETSTEAPSHD